MPGTMQAARLHAMGQPMHVDTVEIPDIGPGEVLIRVLRAGLNRGDLHMRVGQIRVNAGEEASHLPVLPMTIGHDGLGEIVEVGPNVSGLTVGDRVLAKCTLTCGFCKYCRSEREHLCIHHRVMGFVTLRKKEDMFLRYKDGLWAEYCRIPATNVERLRPDDDIDQMALVSQIAVGYRALKRARFGAGQTVIVNGASGITGTGVVLAALAMGAAHVIAIARDPGRLARVRQAAPNRISTISILTESIRDRVAQLTEGNGANVLVDVTPGGVDTTVDCLFSLEPGGRVALIGNNPEQLQIPYLYLMLRSIEFTSTTGRVYADFPELIELTRRGVIDTSHIRPNFFTLDQVNEALDSIPDRASGDVPVWPMFRPA
jgi:alcohol dehydrogenase